MTVFMLVGVYVSMWYGVQWFVLRGVRAQHNKHLLLPYTYTYTCTNYRADYHLYTCN